MKAVRYMLRKLDKSDKDYLFDLLAEVGHDPRKFSPSIEGPTRAKQEVR